MDKESYSFPASPLQRNEYQKSVVSYSETKAVLWSIPAEFMADLKISSADYDQKSMVANNRSTQCPAATAAREDSWNTLAPKLDKLYLKYLLNNDAISASDKQVLNIYTVSHGGATPYAAPATTPILNLSSEKISVLSVIFSDSATPSSHAKPEGVAFCELKYKVDGEVPTSPDSCPDGCFISRSHDPIVFEPSQRGKTVYAYGRWVNRNSKSGPWGSMVTAIIP
ncbi:MAG: hypothetical protein H6Q17_1956 [Bacteroidetes bacterium]|jgi:hypothetical protein|nr:hypothetical protein [Bacteroidota bacterium]